MPGHVVDQRALAARDSGGSKVLSALNAARCDRRDRVAVEPAPQVEDQGFDLGQLGHGAESRQNR